jgi:hypothetical protein
MVAPYQSFIPNNRIPIPLPQLPYLLQFIKHIIKTAHISITATNLTKVCFGLLCPFSYNSLIRRLTVVYAIQLFISFCCKRVINQFMQILSTKFTQIDDILWLVKYNCDHDRLRGNIIGHDRLRGNIIG